MYPLPKSWFLWFFLGYLVFFRSREILRSTKIDKMLTALKRARCFNFWFMWVWHFVMRCKGSQTAYFWLWFPWGLPIRAVLYFTRKRFLFAKILEYLTVLTSNLWPWQCLSKIQSQRETNWCSVRTVKVGRPVYVHYCSNGFSFLVKCRDSSIIENCKIEWNTKCISSWCYVDLKH